MEMLLMCLVVAAIGLTGAVISRNHLTVHHRLDALHLAQELRMSSDDLTRLIRLFIVTGNATYWDYFNQAMDMRAGLAPLPVEPWRVWWDLVVQGDESPRALQPPKAILTRVEDVGFTAEEMALFHRAKLQSDALAEAEVAAANAVFGYFPASYITAVSLSGGLGSCEPDSQSTKPGRSWKNSHDIPCGQLFDQLTQTCGGAGGGGLAEADKFIADFGEYFRRATSIAASGIVQHDGTHMDPPPRFPSARFLLDDELRLMPDLSDVLQTSQSSTVEATEITCRSPVPATLPSSWSSFSPLVNASDTCFLHGRFNMMKASRGRLCNGSAVDGEWRLGRKRPPLPRGIGGPQYPIKAAPNAAYALRIVFSPEYTRARAEIQLTIDRFTVSAHRRVVADTNGTTALSFVVVGLLVSSLLLYAHRRSVVSESSALLAALLPERVVHSVNAESFRRLRGVAAKRIEVIAARASARRRLQAAAIDAAAAFDRSWSLTSTSSSDGDARFSGARNSPLTSPSSRGSAVASRQAAFPVLYSEVLPVAWVAFMDVVNFTALCRYTPAKGVVAVLNELFSLLDAEALNFGIEKIKTIGDAFMCAKLTISERNQPALSETTQRRCVDDDGVDMVRFLLAAVRVARRIARPLPSAESAAAMAERGGAAFEVNGRGTGPPVISPSDLELQNYASNSSRASSTVGGRHHPAHQLLPRALRRIPAQQQRSTPLTHVTWDCSGAPSARTRTGAGTADCGGGSGGSPEQLGRSAVLPRIDRLATRASPVETTESIVSPPLQTPVDLALCDNNNTKNNASDCHRELHLDELLRGHLRVRIGLHLGPVASGIVGFERPLYDLFGDTVNTAARLQAAGRPDCIHVAESTIKHFRASGVPPPSPLPRRREDCLRASSRTDDTELRRHRPSYAASFGLSRMEAAGLGAVASSGGRIEPSVPPELDSKRITGAQPAWEYAPESCTVCLKGIGCLRTRLIRNARFNSRGTAWSRDGPGVGATETPPG
jgi:class 3 adenylate cyclase